MPASDRRHHWICMLLILAALLLAFLCYRPGLEADFHFDDRPSLLGLNGIEDGRSALEYVTSGVAGPTGRPVALASFLVNQGSWPTDPESFLYTNVLIHLINGLLVAWLALRLCLARKEPAGRAGYAASLTAALWMAMPILASTSLLVVQRMTSLSATFVLLGLVGYLLCRAGMERHPGRSLAGMSASLVVFTLLAVLTKENGALLPVFALAIEATLLPKPGRPSSKMWLAWRGVFLWLPAAAILAVLAARVPYPEPTVLARGFGGWERLITEAKILWEYLFNAFVPVDTAQLGPFQDTYETTGSLFEPLTLLAVTGWLAMIGAALLWRRRAPLFAFAVFWFLAGHAIESTVVPLDLYFEHRNYLPLVGPLFAIAWSAVNAPRRHRTFAAIAAIAYTGLLAVTLWVVAERWGNPFREAQEQLTANPTSSRATGYFAARLLAHGGVQPAMMVLGGAIERGVAPERLRASRLYIRCGHYPEREGGEELRRLLSDLDTAAFDRNLGHAIYVLAGTRAGNDCDAVKPQEIEQMLEALARNPAFRRNGETQYWLQRARMRLAAARDDRAARKAHLHAALSHRVDAFTLELMIELHAEDGEFDVACGRLRRYWRDAPWNPVERLNRYLTVDKLTGELNQRAGKQICRIR